MSGFQLNSQQIQQLQEQLNSNDSTSQINNLIAQSTEALTCGPNCQKTRQSEKLKQQYLDAQANVNTAPTQLDSAAKNYYTYTQGTAGYNSFRTTQLQSQAKAIASGATTTFSDGVDSATQLTDTYNSLHATYNNAVELYTRYLNENDELTDEINQINTDTVTSDRKSFYESQGFDKLNSWHSFFKWIYIILLVVYFFGMILAQSSYSFLSKFLILLAFLIYPFVINYVVLLIYNIFARIYTLLPKNAYTTIY